MTNWRRLSVEDITEPSDLVSHAEPGPRCSLLLSLPEKGALTYVLLLPAAQEGSGTQLPRHWVHHFHTKRYSPDLRALEPDRPGFGSRFFHLFALECWTSTFTSLAYNWVTKAFKSIGEKLLIQTVFEIGFVLGASCGMLFFFFIDQKEFISGVIPGSQVTSHGQIIQDVSKFFKTLRQEAILSWSDWRLWEHHQWHRCLRRVNSFPSEKLPFLSGFYALSSL